MATAFWGRKEVFLVNFMPRGTTISMRKDTANITKASPSHQGQTSRNADEGGLISSRQRAPAYGQSDARTDRKVWVESDRALSVQPQSRTQ